MAVEHSVVGGVPVPRAGDNSALAATAYTSRIGAHHGAVSAALATAASGQSLERNTNMGAIDEAVTANLYESDFYGWTNETAKALRERNYRSLDMENLIEEIESMGRTEARELTSRLAQLLTHLLEWEYQWLMRSKSWTFTIKVQRQRATRVLKRNPSLRPRLAELLEDAYDDARIEAEKETGIPIKTFPEVCPYPIESILSDDWLPPARE